MCGTQLPIAASSAAISAYDAESGRCDG
jgi:hypothetical protein